MFSYDTQRNLDSFVFIVAEWESDSLIFDVARGAGVRLRLGDPPEGFTDRLLHDIFWSGLTLTEECIQKAAEGTCWPTAEARARSAAARRSLADRPASRKCGFSPGADAPVAAAARQLPD